MKTWQKNKGRNNWNRKRKQLIKEAVPIQPINKPFTLIKEYPNVVTLQCINRFDGDGIFPPTDYIRNNMLRELAKTIEPYVKFHATYDVYGNTEVYKATVKVLDERGSKLNIYE